MDIDKIYYEFLEKENERLLDINKTLDEENKKLKEKSFDDYLKYKELKMYNKSTTRREDDLSATFASYKIRSIGCMKELIKIVNENTNIKLNVNYSQNKNYFEIIDKTPNENTKRNMKKTSLRNKKEGINKTYLIKEEQTSFYKIGKSKDPKQREYTLQRQTPNIKIVKIWNKDIEKTLHRKYHNHRVRGEWFELTPIQVKHICTNY